MGQSRRSQPLSCAFPTGFECVLLRMKPLTLFWCATAVAACANISTPEGQQAEKLAAAQQLLAANPDRALLITDELLAANPHLRAARLIAAEGSFLLSRQGGSVRSDLLLQDAVRNIEKAINDSSQPTAPETWRLLADCQFDLGAFAGSGTAAMNAARGFKQRDGEQARDQIAAAMLLAGNAELRAFVAERQREVDGGTVDSRGIVVPGAETARMATSAAARFESVRREYPAEATTQTALIYQWLNQPQAAADEFERGIRNNPGQSAIHDAYVAWMVSLGQQQALAGAYSRFLRENPNAVMLHWYQGRALYANADARRQQGNFQGAITGYDKARQSFGQYGAMVPSHSDSTGQWIALCELAMARTAVELGDYDGARDYLFAAAAASPQTTVYDANDIPLLMDSFRSHYTGVAFAIHRALAESGDQALQRTLAFNESVLLRHPDRWGFVYNNAALAARDLGVQVAEGGDEEAAMQLWEKSYAYYEKAVGLSPDDARIVNDCGLMLIYHLNRDFDRARECFDLAIEVGQAQLDGLDADTDLRDRELLEEAVGDAWQNIAVLMHQHLGRPFAEYESFCQQAVKFFPYGRRAAAAMLRNRGAAEATLPGVPQGGGEKAFKAIEKEVRTQAENGDYDGALTRLDKVAKDCKDYAPYQALRGEYNLRLAELKRDAGGSGVEFFFQDAITALSKAVELDSEPNAPRLLLAQAQFAMSDFPAAAKTASALLLHMQSQGGGKDAELLATHRLRADAAARAYTAAKSGGGDAPELLTDARASFRLLEGKDALDQPLCDLWSTTELWAGTPAAAVNIYVRALARNPDDQALLGKLVDTAAAQGQLALAIGALADRKDATALWYLGKALYLRAGVEREGQKTAAALATLDASRKAFEDSMAQNASYRQNCERWIAWSLGKKGNIVFWSDDLDGAEKLLLEAARLSPADVGVDLGLAETTKLGIMRVADKHFRKGDLGKVEAIYRAASDACSGDLDLLNNSGLFARDYGNQLERAGKNEAAKDMYEQSYKAYSRAQQLDPTNVRLRNDCALIAIYHLERDWDLAKKLLDAAIVDGETTLGNNPPEDADARQQLDEAVGDCYENLALWHLKHSKDGNAAKAAAIKSQGYYPGKGRQGAQRHLRAAERLLQGK